MSKANPLAVLALALAAAEMPSPARSARPYPRTADARNAYGFPRPAPEPEPAWTAAERAGMDRLLAQLNDELHDQFDPADIAWVVEAALWQLARLIRDGQPLTLPDLGTFTACRVAGAPVVRFAPSNSLLESLA